MCYDCSELHHSCTVNVNLIVTHEKHLLILQVHFAIVVGQKGMLLILFPDAVQMLRCTLYISNVCKFRHKQGELNHYVILVMIS